MAEPLKSPMDKPDNKKEEQKPKATEEKTLDKKLQESWNKRDGELSEVFDSEGHRVRINRY